MWNPMSSHTPSLEESGLKKVEYDIVSGITVSKLMILSTVKKEGKGKYTWYKPQQRSIISKYAMEKW